MLPSKEYRDEGNSLFCALNSAYLNMNLNIIHIVSCPAQIKPSVYKYIADQELVKNQVGGWQVFFLGGWGIFGYGEYTWKHPLNMPLLQCRTRKKARES